MSIKQTHMWSACEDKIKQTRDGKSTYWVWDVANSVHLDFARYRKCVNPV